MSVWGLGFFIVIGLAGLVFAAGIAVGLYFLIRHLVRKRDRERLARENARMSVEDI